jgi:quinol monooxygenase YgiN
MIAGSSNKSDTVGRRGFVREVIVASGVTVLCPSWKDLIDNIMANKYGLYGKLQAQAGKGQELSEILLKAAKLMEQAKGCILYIVSKTANNPDTTVYVIEVWDSKEDHDNSLKLPGVRELISQAMPILDGKPDGITLEVLGGKGIG